jgi:hypothetical protein
MNSIHEFALKRIHAQLPLSEPAIASNRFTLAPMFILQTETRKLDVTRTVCNFLRLQSSKRAACSVAHCAEAADPHRTIKHLS